MARILLVEDSLTIISKVEQTLRDAGHDVIVARDGLSALASVRALMPDAMLLDLMLPHVSGFDVCSTVRRNQRYKPMPILIITALADDDSRKKAMDAGADEYIIKPVSDEHLVKTLEQHLAAAATTKVSTRIGAPKVAEPKVAEPKVDKNQKQPSVSLNTRKLQPLAG